MSSGAAPATAEPEARFGTAIQIDVGGRWDAVALMELLVPFHSFLVQHKSDRWVVHARTPGCHGESLADALGVVEKWQAKRAVRASGSVARHSHRTTEMTSVTTVAHPQGGSDGTPSNSRAPKRGNRGASR